MRRPKWPDFRAPASVMIARAQITFLAAILLPTVASTALGVVMLTIGESSTSFVVGILLLAFCSTTLTGYILGSNYLARGASLAHVQNDFVSSVSHELRTPLTSIRMFIETLQGERLTDPRQREDCLSMLSQEVDRLQGLVNRVIELSRWETGRVAFEADHLDAREIVQEAVEAMRANTLSRPVKVTISADSGYLPIKGERASLVLALSNLLMNAWKYGTSTEHDEIWVKVEGHERDVLIAVVDNGPGIPWGEQRRIFEQFERGRAARDSRMAGSGLGLAIVRAIVHAHGGRVDLRSFPGKGAEFRIRLRRSGGTSPSKDASLVLGAEKDPSSHERTPISGNPHC
ncbi:MAG: HAMP domain-containing histidine kinase [Myxococcales bacterium]|nr:HAMP domain-containing histidine kinase [Myxococcales bacterium]